MKTIEISLELNVLAKLLEMTKEEGSANLTAYLEELLIEISKGGWVLEGTTEFHRLMEELKYVHMDVVEQILDDERESYRQLVEEMKEVVAANTEVLQKILGAANDEAEKQQALDRKKKLDELNRQLGMKYETAFKLQKSIDKYPADHLVELEEMIWSEISCLEEQCLELE
jgi:hypothetical protein